LASTAPSAGKVAAGEIIEEGAACGKAEDTVEAKVHVAGVPFRTHAPSVIELKLYVRVG
jgi:hypothetical protein